MATITSFEDIEAWQLARNLCREIYKLTANGTFAKDFGLKNQIRKSSGSIMDNIAEGFERGGNKEFVHFLSIAKGSSGEVRSQLYRAFDCDHINDVQLQSLLQQCIVISRKISGLMKYLNSSEVKGSKFLEPEEAYEPSTLNLKP